MIDDGIMHLTRQLIQIRNSFIHPVNNQDSSQEIPIDALYYRYEICDQTSLYSGDEFLRIFEYMAAKGLLYDSGGVLSIKMDVVNYQIGVKLALKVIMGVYHAIFEKCLLDANS